MEALLIIDLQEGYIGDRRGEHNFDSVLEHINYVAPMFRKAGKPVIVIRDIGEGDGPLYCNVKELKLVAGDLEVLKLENNSFWETDLDQLLKKLEVNFLVLCGYAAEYCVTATYFGANERGYKAAMLQNGVLAASKEGLASLNKNRPLISHSAIDYLLSK